MVDVDNISKHSLPRPDGWTLFGGPEDFDSFPKEQQDQILFLDKEADKFIYGYAGALKLVSDEPENPFSKNNFKVVEEYTALSDEPELRKWLYRRGIPFDCWVFILPKYSDFPIYATWKMVIKHCQSIFFSDDVLVFDKTANWCLFYFHEEHLFFGRGSIYDPSDDYKRMEELNDLKKKYPHFKFPY